MGQRVAPLFQRAILVALLVNLYACNVDAQDRCQLGFKFGLNSATLIGQQASSQAYLPDETRGVRKAVVGGLIVVRLSGQLAVQGEVLFSSYGADWETFREDSITTETLSLTVKFSYLEMPVLLTYSLAEQGRLIPYFGLGLQPGINVSNSARQVWVLTEYGAMVSHADDVYSRIRNCRGLQFAALVSGGLHFSVGPTVLTLDARYTKGIRKIFGHLAMHDPVEDGPEIFFADPLSGEASNYQHRVFSISLSVTFPL